MKPYHLINFLGLLKFKLIVNIKYPFAHHPKNAICSIHIANINYHASFLLRWHFCITRVLEYCKFMPLAQTQVNWWDNSTWFDNPTLEYKNWWDNEGWNYRGSSLMTSRECRGVRFYYVIKNMTPIRKRNLNFITPF